MTAFTWYPQSAQKDSEPRVRTAPFGDGYQQDVADGINNIKDKWQLTFTVLHPDLLAIEAFLRSAAGVDAFDWTPPGESSAIRAVCKSWSSTPHTGLRTGGITANFEQVFGR